MGGYLNRLVLHRKLKDEGEVVACEFDWKSLIDWQLHSFGGNPANVVEVVSELDGESTRYIKETIEAKGYKNVAFWQALEASTFFTAGTFKDGEVSFAFLNGTPEQTALQLETWYPKVHFNSLMAGSGASNPVVMRAVHEFFGKKDLPIKVQGSCWILSHCHKPKELW